MDKLWAPWRAKYIHNCRKKAKKCIFCAAIKRPSSELFIISTKYSIALLNIYPYNNGHMLIAPKRHVKDTSDLKEEEGLDLFSCLNKSKSLLDRTLHPHGYNIGLNLGKAAGAGIPGHLHIHLVPRWKYDTNFMPVIADTRIISQSLKGLRQKFKKCSTKKR